MAEENHSKLEDIDILKKISGGASIYLVGKVASNILNFVVNLLLTRTLGASHYGIYSLSNTVLSFLIILCRLGSGKSMLKFIPAANNKRIKNSYITLAISTTLISSILFSTLLFMIAPFINDVTLNEAELTIVLRIFAIFLPFYALFNLFGEIFRSLNLLEYKVLTIYLVEPVAKILFISISILVGYELIGITASIGVSFLFVLFISVSVLMNKYSFSVTRHNDNIMLKEYYNFSLPLTFKDLGENIYKRVDILMVGIFLASADVGIYQIALLIAGVLILPLHGIHQLFAPIASSLYEQGKKDQLERIYSTATRWSFTLVAPAFILTLIYSSEIIVVFGEEFTSGAMALSILAFGQFVNVSVGPSGTILMMTEHQYISMVNQWILGISNVVLNYILIQEFGIIGAAVATAATLVFINILKLIEIWILEGLFPYSSKYIKPLFASILMCIISYILSILFSGFILLIFGSLFSFLMYSVFVYLLGIEKEDIELIGDL